MSATNPLKTDPELKALLESSSAIESTEQFDGWKESFLERLHEFLDPQGVANAERGYEDMSKIMNILIKKTMKLENLILEGKLSKSSTSVKGRNALNEVNRSSTDAMEGLIKFMPGNSSDEKEMGYDKFQLGAVLVRDGFELYETMCMCRDVLEQCKDECLNDVADRQTLDAIDYYIRQIKRFCDVMADLGLYELMIQSHKMRKAERASGKTTSKPKSTPKKEDDGEAGQTSPSTSTKKKKSGDGSGKKKGDGAKEKDKDKGNASGEDSEAPPSPSKKKKKKVPKKGDGLPDAPDSPSKAKKKKAKKKDQGDGDGDGGGGNGDDGPPPNYDEGDANAPPRPDMRIQVGTPLLTTYNKKLRHDDCVLVPEFFGEEGDMSMYEKIMKEISDLQKKKVANTAWTPSSDGGKHMVCPDPSKSLTFKIVLNKATKYFNIKKTTIGYRLNYYRDSKDVKPLHHDMSAYDPKEHKTRPVAITASFGLERQLSFDYQGSPAPPVRVYVPLPNNSLFLVGRDVNIRFAHTIVGTDKESDEGRISIMIWGTAQDAVEEPKSPPRLAF